MVDIIKIAESLEKSRLLVDYATELLKHEKKPQQQQQQQEVGLLGTMMASMAASLIEPMASSLIEPMASSLIQPAVLSLINIISSKGVIRAGKGQKSGFHPFLAASLILKAIAGKGVTRLGK